MEMFLAFMCYKNNASKKQMNEKNKLKISLTRKNENGLVCNDSTDVELDGFFFISLI